MGKNIGTGADARASKAEELEERRLRSLAANMVFGLALVDRDLKLLRFNSRFKSVTGGRVKSGSLLCDGLLRDCSVPDGCASCPVKRCFEDGLNYEREFARQDEGGQERYYRFVASPARAASGAQPRSSGSVAARSLASGGKSSSSGTSVGNAGVISGGGPVGSSGGNSGSVAKPGTGESAEAILTASDLTLPGIEDAATHKPGLVLVLVEDITRKRIIEQKLLRAQRLEAMSTLAGGIAHEINQPLSALNLYASGLKMLLDKNEAPPRDLLKERIELILEQARKISEITQHMRSMAIQSATVHESVDVRAALREALGNCAAKCEALNIRLEAHIPDVLPPVRAVGIQLSQVLNNLLDNAVHAAKEAQGEKIIRISAHNDEQRLFIEVADSGPGIPPGQERRIFDPFYTTKGPSEGMGLGLSIIHAFVSSWGGEVQVRARHPRLGGAVFGIAMNVSSKKSSI
ncbi:GHKL domain-containing protein [Desulfovibrio sp. OttesenSCG-928-C06]|nr:GHKL domain-containing protein [Desulfovibrio sp. OttesenSCG-928-C06]